MSDPSRLSRRYSTMLIAGIAVVVLTSLASLLPVPYVTLRPGPVFNTLGEFEDKPMIVIDGTATTYPTDGTLDFTTVSVSRANAHLDLGSAIVAWFNGDVAVVPKSLIYPDDQTAEESKEEGAAQLSGSKDASEVAGLRAAGYEVGEIPIIDSVLDDGAAKGQLEAQDKVLAVDGTKVSTVDEVVRLISSLKPGEPVRLTVKRNGTTETVRIVTQPSPEDPARARIGITLGVKYKFPFEVTNNVGESIGGPSAGTMFALAIYDMLTPGSLTGGATIAGTGTISGDGLVGPIGGIRQKMAGAADDGAKIFLAPAANCAEAADGDDFGMTVVKVGTLDDAINALEALANDPGAEVATCR